ncbi:MAG: SURF1 family protein [Novosphingobium sp.]|nr:SURF1 family protein [Novosphingobium sp.]
MGRLPLVPTLLVLAAVGVMIALGFWQIERLHEKEALLARYQAAASSGADAAWPHDLTKADGILYRRTRVLCVEVTSLSSIAGRNAGGEAGLSQSANCRLANGGEALVILGWSREPSTPDWRGGKVTGIVAPGPRIVADPPLAGLEANARPDPSEIPNNHLSYAVQWFLFAATALVIYVLALRKRLADKPGQG